VDTSFNELKLTADYDKYQDINQDGESEGLQGMDGRLVADGSILPVHCIGALETTEVVAGEVVVTHRCVLDSARFQAILQSLGFVPVAAWAYFYGWRDMDGDGDRDSIIRFYASDDAFASVTKFYWLENTGYEATQPLVGDLDGDGAVGASDLTMLLGGWTGN
jgi:hypothetical protein